MARILNIETATRICSVALAKDGKTVSIRETREERSHASAVAVFIREIIEEQAVSVDDLNAVCISKGPGSYTGLRIGVSTAKGLCYGADVPLLSLETLHILCSAALSNKEVQHIIDSKKNGEILLCPMIDARRMEVFTALFDVNMNKLSDTEARIISSGSYQQELENYTILFFGDGARKCNSIIRHSNSFFIDNIELSARYMSSLVERLFQQKVFENVAYFEPYYLKDFIATVPKKIF